MTILRSVYRYISIIAIWTACCVCTSADSLRFATFNSSLNQCDDRTSPCLSGGLEQLLTDPEFVQGRQVAEIIQRVRPDVILLNEFNYDATGNAANLFVENFLSTGQNASRHPDGPAEPIAYPYVYVAPSNTGIHSGFDLDNNGQIVSTPGTGLYAGDAYGFGEFEGRYGMLFLSKHPIQFDQVRTFQNMLWEDMPDSLLPQTWYSPEEQQVLRLSSKSHWDLPVQIGETTVHFLASHPTPPVFDGPEDRNGRRNHDEIRFWSDYISSGEADYIVDDAGVAGGLGENDAFVVLGDLNSDPDRGDGRSGAIKRLLDHPEVNSTLVPQRPNGATHTATFRLRVDYVLPSSNLETESVGIFWPETRDPLA